MIEDQQTLPEDLREFPSARHPNASSSLYQSQEKLQLLEDMKDPEWYPQGTKYDVYQQEGWQRQRGSEVESV